MFGNKVFFVITAAVFSFLLGIARADASDLPLDIPEAVVALNKRPITIADYVNVRLVDTLSLSPDGQRFALLIRQADPEANRYRTGWFVGDLSGAPLVKVGDGGDLVPLVSPSGLIGGDLSVPKAVWSPDGKWIAYALRKDGEVQLWRSRVDGRLQEQLTHSPGDVGTVNWSSDGSFLFFTVGESRSKIEEQDAARARLGYSYDQDLFSFTDLMRPGLRHSPSANATLWAYNLRTKSAIPASAEQRAAFASVPAGQSDMSELHISGAVAPPVISAAGYLGWLQTQAKFSSLVRIWARRGPTERLMCAAEACEGAIRNIWWSKNGKTLYFWRGEGINNQGNGFYAWQLQRNNVRRLLRLSDDKIKACAIAASDNLVCIREKLTWPQQVVSINLHSGKLSVLADPNPEFRNIRLGRIERIEWNTPELTWNQPGGRLAGLFPKRAYGYIFYPPDFDPRRKYPVFISPYVTHTFNRQISEQALHVYAANGIVVLDEAFPVVTDFGRFGADLEKLEYDPQLEFPRLTMLAESTLQGLRKLAARGFIDKSRVGIGGVSHGSFVPLYILQKFGGITAISISNPNWTADSYYDFTDKMAQMFRTERGAIGYTDWRPKPEGAGAEFWKDIDIADHIDQIDAPILMNLADVETFPLVRLMRYMRDAHKPYDAYVFPGEYHLKWQPAHMQTDLARNLDWFRFWLQGYEDSDPTKREQYVRWEKLCDLQRLEKPSRSAFCVPSRSRN